jgi:phage tail-like protein
MPSQIKELLSSMASRGVDPFPTFKFHVEVGELVTAAFTECTGLEMSTEVFEYKEGGLNAFVHKFPGRTMFGNVTLKKGFALTNDLFHWYREVEASLATGGAVRLRPVSITLYTTAAQGTQMRWSLDRAFPVRWVGPTFRSEEAAFAVESIEFAHHGVMTV